MANIREDKKALLMVLVLHWLFLKQRLFLYCLRVGADVCSAAMTEIEKEMAILKKEAVREEELSLVRNYMLGSMLGSLERTFSRR